MVSIEEVGKAIFKIGVILDLKNRLLKNFFVFHLILMKLGEVVVIHVYILQFHKVHQNQMKTKILY